MAKASGWTAERRARQAALIHDWRPWEQSTGPRTPEGKVMAARNAFRGGEWRKVRQAIKEMNAALRGQASWLERLERST